MEAPLPGRRRNWSEIMADTRPFDVDADIAEIPGLWGGPRPRMTPEELQAWSEGLEQLHREMRAEPGWEDIDVDEELRAMREERLARFDTPE